MNEIEVQQVKIWSNIVKTLDFKEEYQLKPMSNTWYLFAPLQRVQLRFLEELYQK